MDKRYEVHVFEVVRVKLVDITADSPEAAARLATERYKPDDLFMSDAPVTGVEYTEYADETSGYLVDEVTGGDSHVVESVYLNPNFEREPMSTCASRHAKE